MPSADDITRCEVCDDDVDISAYRVSYGSLHRKMYLCPTCSAPIRDLVKQTRKVTRYQPVVKTLEEIASSPVRALRHKTGQ